MSKVSVPTDRTALRALVGSKGKSVPFTAGTLAEAVEVTTVTARKHIDRLVEEGIVAPAGTRKVTDAEGNPSRGRPAHLFVVTPNPKRGRKAAAVPESGE